MFRKLSRMLCLVLAFTMVFASGSVALAATVNGYVKTPTPDGAANLRRGPGMSYSVIGWGRCGDPLVILSKGSSWHRVRLVESGKVGYMRSIYVAASSNLNKIRGNLGQVNTRYQGSYVNIRKGPGMNYGVKTSLVNGTSLRVLSRKGNWYRVQTLDGKLTGYISKTYLEMGATAMTTGDVYLRKGAGTRYSALRVVRGGSRITVLNVGKGWSKVRAGGRTGYMSNLYIALS